MSSRVDIHVRQLSDGTDRRVTSFDGVVNDLAFSKDGRELTFTTGVVGEPLKTCAVPLIGEPTVKCG